MEQRNYSELTFVQLLRIFRRRTKLIVIGAVVGLLAGIALCIFTPRRYEAAASIEVQNGSRDGLDRNTLMGSGPTPTDPLDADVTLQTQARILQSNTIALRTIHKLNLDKRRELQPQPNPVASLNPIAYLIPRTQNGPDRPEAAETRLLRVFENNLEVKPVPGTRLISVAYTSTNPQLASDIANSLVHELAEYAFETTYKATEASGESLRQELATLRTQSEALQAKVAAMQQESGMYSIGTTDAQGRQQAYSAVLDQFQRAATTLSDATQNRVLKQAVFDAVQNGDAELLSSLAGNASGSGTANSMATVQQLRSQEATLQGQLDQLKVKFGSGYPKVAELQGNLDSVRNSIQLETKRIGDRAKNDFTIAEQTWKNALENYQEQKVQADALNNKTIKYMIARQEADESRSLYLDLLKKLKESGVLQGLKSGIVTVVDSALVPVTPKTPNVPVYMACALAGGIFAGCVWAMVSDLVDDRVLDVGLVEEIGGPLLGMIPAEDRSKKTLEVIENPVSGYSDAIRSIRCGLIQATRDRSVKVLMVTAAAPSREKSVFSINLAASAAQAGKKVLLVECDMRNPQFRKLMNLQGGVGLGQVLMGEMCNGNVTRLPQLGEMQVLPSDPKPPNPSALIESDRMFQLLRTWRTTFDLIVIDAPAVMPYADVRVLSPMVDVNIQLVESGATTVTAVKRASEALGKPSTRNSYVVLSGVKPQSDTYRSYYGVNGTAAKATGDLS